MKSSQLKPNDILINITGASIGRTCIVPSNIPTANINQHIIYLRFKPKYVPYISNYFKTISVKDYINLIQAGTSKEALNLGQTLNTALILPPLTEQIQIANYIDTKTQALDKKINLLITKIEYYKELRKTIINNAVTKGLDKKVKLKESGIEWIGKIPEHWQVNRLKSVGNIETSSVNKNIEENEKLVKLVNYTDVYGNSNKEIRNDENYMVVSANKLQVRQKRLFQGDVLFTPSSETIEDIGVSAVVMENLKDTLYSYHLLRLRFSFKMDLYFKKYLFNNTFVQSYLSKSATGTTRKILGLNSFYNLPIVFPPTVKEQTEIATYLDAKTSTMIKLTPTYKHK
jgi:type I restriction enzyme S subunit